MNQEHKPTNAQELRFITDIVGKFSTTGEMSDAKKFIGQEHALGAIHLKHGEGKRTGSQWRR
jgi:hypothetical protein